MISGFSGPIGTPIYGFEYTELLFKIHENVGTFSTNRFFINLRNAGLHFCSLGKDRTRNMMKIHLRISSRSWIWDQYLPENMK